MRARVRWRATGVLLALLTLMTACGRGAPAGTAQPQTGPGAPPATGQEAQPTQRQQTQPQATGVPDDEKPLRQPYKIVVGVVDNLFGTVFWSAVEKGFFLKHGIQAQVKPFATGQEVAKALRAGDVQLGTSAMNNFQTEIAGGIKHTAVFTSMGNGASLINDAPLAIVAGPDAGIRAGHPEDLKGKTVGLPLGGTAELYLRAVLNKAGVDPKDVKMVNVPASNSVTVLRNKNVDAVSAWEPYNALMLREVPGSVEVQRAGGYFGYVIFGLVEEKTVRENPDLVLRMVAAYAESAAWVRQNPDAAGEVASHWIQGLDPKVAAGGLKNVLFDPRITTFTRQAWDLSNQLLMRDQKLKAPVPMEGNFNTSFLDQVLKDHPDYFKDLAPATSVTIR